MAGFDTLATGSGFWNPLLWILAVVVAVIIAYIIWWSGEKSYKKETEQVTPFISGNPEPGKGAVHLRAGSLYWGFTEALRGYYRWMIPLHSGIVTDYLLWMFALVVIFFVLMVVI